MTVIYALCEPETGEVRYIGKAADLQKRLSKHFAPVYLAPETHKKRWLRRLLADGERPGVIVLEDVRGRPWQEAEREWIARYRESGANLTNILDGGDGGRMSTELSTETRAKISTKSRQRKHPPMPPELRAKLHVIHTGAKRSDETRAKIRAKALGRRLTDEHRARLSQRRLGHVVSDEQRAKVSAALKGRKHSPEAHANMVTAARLREEKRREHTA